MTARIKAQTKQALMIGWMAERFAREKKLHTPDYWLKSNEPQTPEQGAANLRGMIARMKAKQEAENGTR